MMLLLPKWLAGFSGVFVDNFGYQAFFYGTAIIGAPVLLLIWVTIHFKIVQTKKEGE
jgi:PAT family beta-lactamase induction signal transducer AmpG